MGRQQSVCESYCKNVHQAANRNRYVLPVMYQKDIVQLLCKQMEYLHTYIPLFLLSKKACKWVCFKD